MYGLNTTQAISDVNLGTKMGGALNQYNALAQMHGVFKLHFHHNLSPLVFEDRSFNILLFRQRCIRYFLIISKIDIYFYWTHILTYETTISCLWYSVISNCKCYALRRFGLVLLIVFCSVMILNFTCTYFSFYIYQWSNKQSSLK